MDFTIVDRALGCLKGIATGDAIGKQTENLSREDLRRWYPYGIRGFEGTPGAAHDGCGAAIRVAPVGIVFSPHCLDELVNGASHASISTHGGSMAIAAAAATAAAVSAAVESASSQEVFELAERAAVQAESRWPGRTSPAFAGAMRAVRDDLSRLSALRAAEVAERWFPNRPLTIVPLAVALATLMRSAEDAILLAANIGGDSDSVASIAGGILGAMYPDTVDQRWYDIVENINEHGFVSIARELVRLRS